VRRSGAPRAEQPAAAQAGSAPALPAPPGPAPTAHAPVSRDLSGLWLVPPEAGHAVRTPNAALAGLVTGVHLHADQKYDQALPLVSAPALADTLLAGYAAYYTAAVELKLGRPDEARRKFAALGAGRPPGRLAEAAALGEAEAAEAQKEYAAALGIYDSLWDRKPSAPDELWLRIAKAAHAAGDARRAAEAYLRLYCEYPLSDLAAEAGAALKTLAGVEPIGRGTPATVSS